MNKTEEALTKFGEAIKRMDKQLTYITYLLLLEKDPAAAHKLFAETFCEETA